MKKNIILKKLIVAILSVALLIPATSFLDNGNNYAQAVNNGWVKVGYDWYYYENGVPLKNQWKHYFYYLKSDGKMANNEWVYDNNEKAWYFFSQDGRFKRDAWIQWDFRRRDYYYLHPSGKMAHDQWIDYFYYVKSDGKMARDEWIYDNENSAWYYLDEKGKFLSSVWKKDYYLKSNGKMARNEWISDKGSSYYIGADGKYLRSVWYQDYYLKADGRMASDEWIYDNGYESWYYLGYFGKYYKNAWKGDYYLKSDGKMAHDEWIGKYYFGKDGKWVK